MRVLSLFDGMSCGRIALEKAGAHCSAYFASEVDTHAMQVAANNWPSTEHVGDVRLLEGADFPNIDLLIGGSPCQSFSFAGRRKGMSTKEGLQVLSLETYLELKSENFEFEGQSYLFWEYVRLLKEVKPRYFLLENVKMAPQWKKIISEVLGVEPILINSSLVSAQSRNRLYWTNIPQDGQPEDLGLLLNDVLDPQEVDRATVEDTPRNLRHERDHSQKGLCATATMYKGAGNNGMTLIRRKPGEKLSTLSVLEVERLQTVPEDYTKGVSNTQRYKMLGNGWTVDVIAHIFKGLGQTPNAPLKAATPEELDRLGIFRYI